MAETGTPASACDTPDWSEGQRPKPPPSRRRDKAQLSCNLCRRRKLKCDRQHPCSTCSKRGLSLSCTYAHGQPLSSFAAASSSQAHRPPTDIQGRLDQLEGLLFSLKNEAEQSKQTKGVTEDASTAFTPFSIPESSMTADSEEPGELPLSDNFGRMSLDNSETSYVGSAHWIAILDGIAELKDHFQANNTPSNKSSSDYYPRSDFDGPELLYGHNKYVTKDEILAALPPRPLVDRLISQYFNAMDMAPAILHSGQFLREYEQFWRIPTDAPIMWLGLLCTMICLATQFQSFSSQAEEILRTPSTITETRFLVQKYREMVVGCLVLGKYTKPGPYTIETLLLYFTIEHFLSPDSDIGTWVLLGIVVRLSLRMGYHRDPSHSPKISPFLGEKRRRVWATITQLDLMSSTQMGLPRMTNAWQSDTAEPRNLLDDDFDEDLAHLPPSRPDSDLTPMLYLLAKNRILSGFGMVSDLATNTRRCSYAEVMRVDTLLREDQQSIPSILRLRSMALSITDSPHIILYRIYLDILCHKAQCVLHRRYLAVGGSNDLVGYSRRSCLQAALAILQHQYTIDEETQLGGQLHPIRWKISSVVHHEFLLATTVLCAEFSRTVSATSPIANKPANKQGTEDLEQSLQRSYRIWLKSCNTSKEAQKAAAALEVVLGKTDSSANEMNSTESMSNTENVSNTLNNEFFLNHTDDTYDLNGPLHYGDSAMRSNFHAPAATPVTLGHPATSYDALSHIDNWPGSQGDISYGNTFMDNLDFGIGNSDPDEMFR